MKGYRFTAVLSDGKVRSIALIGDEQECRRQFGDYRASFPEEFRPGIRSLEIREFEE